MNIYRTLFSDAFLYGFVNAFSKLLSFFLFPLLATYFSVIEYGILDYAQSFTTFIILSITFGMDSALVRFFYDTDKTENRKQLISEIFYFQLILVIIFIVFLIFFKNSVLEMINSKIKGIYEILIFQIPFVLIMNFCQNILRWTFQRKLFIIISVSYLTTLLIYCLVGVYILSFDLHEYFLGSLLIQILFSTISLYFISHWIKKVNDIFFLKRILNYAIPLGIVSTLTASYPFLERNLILIYSSEYSFGLYSIIYKYSLIILIIVYSFQIAWGPISYTIYKEKAAEKNFNSVFNIITFIVFQAVLILYYLSDIILPWFFGDKINEMYKLILPLSFTLGIQGITLLLESSIHLSKKTIWILATNLLYIGCFLSILIWEEITINLIIFTMCFSSLIKFISTGLISNNIYKIKWKLGQVLSIISITLMYLMLEFYYDIIERKLILLVILLNMVVYLIFNHKKVKKFLNGYFQITKI